ncbi:MAG: hypothetical protein A3H61_02315, partial [Candidatus Jacksonbacteria bacterium RIFCSPLOWO2_02_FULL_44_20]
MKIGIIGAGYVGIVTGVCLAEKGHTVVCYDIDSTKIRALKKGRVPFYEPDVADLLSVALKKGRIDFVHALNQCLSYSKIVFVCVGTPPRENGSADMSYFYKAISGIAIFGKDVKNSEFIVVNKSTVPVGTARDVHKHFRKCFTVVSNPEFLREGKAVSDFFNPDRIVLGFEDQSEKSAGARKQLTALYEKFDCPKIITNWETAELIKYASNAYLATKISFINEIAALSERVRADVKTIAKGMGFDPRIGKEFLRAGIGYGGSCFPKDVRALQSLSRGKRYSFKLLKSVIDVNNQQRKIAVEKIMSAFSKNRVKRAAILGATFKPDTDDVRESASIAIIKELHIRGVNVRVFDPQGSLNARRELKRFPRALVVGSVEDAVR